MTNPVMRSIRSSNQDGTNVCLAHWIWCPGCETVHRPQTRLSETSVDFSGPLWDWDGNTESPTFSPSYKTWWSEGPEHIERICHSFIRNGQWHFLDDCTHSLAGQIVDMVPVPDWVARWGQ